MNVLETNPSVQPFRLRVLPVMIALALLAMHEQPAIARSNETSAAFTATQLVRQFTLRNTVAQVSQGMQGYVQEFNDQLRGFAMGPTPNGYPVGMGSVPIATNLPRRDGAGRPLGYCAWDNASVTTDANFLAGSGLPNPLLYAVISPGLNGSIETSCADIHANKTGNGDDFVQVTVPIQTSSRQFRSSIGTEAELFAMAGEEGDVRLVAENNRLYSYLGGVWTQIGPATTFNDDSAANGAGAISYTTGKVTMAEFEAMAATINAGLTVGGSTALNAGLTVSGSTALNGGLTIAGDTSMTGNFTATGSITSATGFSGNGSALTNLNTSQFTTGVLPVARGGTGVDGTNAVNGSLLIGNGTGFALGNITGTANQIAVTNGAGSIALSLPQNIASTSSPTFGGMVLNGGLTGTTGTFSGSSPKTLTVRSTAAGNPANEVYFDSLISGPNQSAAIGMGTAARDFFIWVNGSDRLTISDTGVTSLTGALNVNGTITANGFAGNGSGLTNLNASNISTGILPVARGGTGVDGTNAVNGSLLIGNGTGFALGNITGTANQIAVTNGAGSIALSLPQNIASTSSPTFGGMVLNGGLTGTTGTFSGSSTRTLTLRSTAAGNSANEVYFDSLISGANQSAAIGMGTAARDFFIWVNGSDRLTISDTGVTSLTEALNVNGTINANASLNFDLAATGPKRTLIQGQIGNPGDGFSINFDNQFGGIFNNDFLVIEKNDRSQTSPDGGIAFANTGIGGTAYSMVINGNGRVGIGTISPSTQLQVAGTVTASGFAGNGSALTNLNTSQFTTGVLPVARGGTGVDGTNAANGRLLIGNGTGFALGNITGTANQIVVTNGAGSIALSLPQDIATTSSPTFAAATVQRLNVGTSAGGVTDPNLIIGNGAMPGVQSGAGGNTAVGIQAMAANTSGHFNTGLGNKALTFNTTGDSNTATGISSLEQNTTGSSNTANGRDALFLNTTGSNNTAMGKDSGYNNTTGNNNTFLGNDADVASGGLSYATAIGSHSNVATSNTIVLGRNTMDDQVVIGSSSRNDTFANTTLYVNGATNLNGTLTVAGDSTFDREVIAKSFRVSNDIATPISGQGAYLRWNRVGAEGKTYLINQRGAGGGGISFGESTKGNVYTENMLLSASGDLSVVGSITVPRLNISTSAGGVTDPNLIIGTGAMTGVQSGLGGNTAVGFNSLQANIDGYDNSAFGAYAMLSTTSGYNNSAFGKNALRDNTTGSWNAVFGDDAMRFNTTGTQNSAFGDDALFSNTTGYVNTATGSNALRLNTSGYANAAVGANSLQNNTTGYRNSALGEGALQNNNTGFENTAVGEDSLKGNTTGTRNVAIGSDSGILNVTGSNNTIIGYNADFTSGALSFAAAFGSDSRVATSDTIALGRNSSADQVVIGTDSRSGSHKLYVDGTALITGGVTTSSDLRLKTNVQQLDNQSMLDKLSQIGAYRYNYINNPEAGKKVGVIAQELQALFPEVANYGNGDPFLSVDYSALGAMAAVGVGQLNTKVKALDGRITEQGDLIKGLDEKLGKVDTRVAGLEDWKTGAVKKMDDMQSAIDLNIQKIADHAVAIQTNKAAIERLDDALFTLDGKVKSNSDLISNISARWNQNFSASEDGSLLTVNAVELKVSNFTAQNVRANSVYAQRIEAEMARIAELEVNNLRANTAVANTVQAEQVNTGSAQVYAGVGLPAILFAAKSDGHYTVNTSALDGSYATATVIVNAGRAKVISGASEGIELYAEGNMVKAIAAGKSIKASWIKMG